MSEKIEILSELGEPALLLPGQIDRALAANDRVKYYMTLLQTAASHAEAPAQPVPDLSVERIAAGVSDVGLDRIPQASRREDDALHIPRAEAIYDEMRGCLEAMLLPIQTSAHPDFDAAPFEERLPRVAPEHAVVGEQLPAQWVQVCTRTDRTAGDSLHLLVMDMHRTLNRLQAAIAPETLDGAAVYDVAEDDRARVRAFMAGLNRTAPLKFNHPGLATTATRSGSVLLLQNDIGTTDAHVLVVRVERMDVTVTYTDVHPERAEFFRALLDPFDAAWTLSGARAPGWQSEEASYVLLTGRYHAPDEADLGRFLSFLGSRLVFLIDWNRARRALGKFVRNRVAVDILGWAAREDFGHRAFVQLGDARMVADLIDRAAPEPLPYGHRLDDILGEDVTADCLRSILRIASTGLSAGRSERLIRDEVRSELARRFRSFEERLLELSAEHLILASDLAAAMQQALTQVLTERDQPALDRLARRAAQWEVQADTLAAAARVAETQNSRTEFYGPLLRRQDDIADGLEDAIFLCTLLQVSPAVRAAEAPLSLQSDLVVRGVRALVTCVACAHAMHRDGTDEDLRDFLEAVDDVVTIEHEGDAASRDFERALVDVPDERRQQHLLDRISTALEFSLDAMSHTALSLRDHMMSPRSGR